METPKVKFSLKCKERTVDVETPDAREKRFIVRELNGKDRDTFSMAIESRKKFTPEGKFMTSSTEGLSQLLLSLALFEEDGKTRVSRGVIDGWPTSTVEGLASMALELSGLGGRIDAVSADDAGND